MISRILVAYDGSDGAHRALEVGAELAAALDAEIGIVSVVPERPGAPGDPWSETSTHAAQLHDATAFLRERGLAATTHEPMGEAGPMIVAVAAEFGYDALVLGPRDLGRIRRAVQGSVSAYVSTHADASVIIARQRAR